MRPGSVYFFQKRMMKDVTLQTVTIHAPIQCFEGWFVSCMVAVRKPIAHFECAPDHAPGPIGPPQRTLLARGRKIEGAAPPRPLCLNFQAYRAAPHTKHTAPSWQLCLKFQPHRVAPHLTKTCNVWAGDCLRRPLSLAI